MFNIGKFNRIELCSDLSLLRDSSVLLTNSFGPALNIVQLVINAGTL
jgi:hypothetical protein